MVSFIIGLVIITLCTDVYIFSKISKGLRAFYEENEDTAGWVLQHLLVCILFGTMFTVGYYFLSGGFIQSGTGEIFSLAETVGAFIISGGFVWLVNLFVFSLVINENLGGYVDYKRSCITVGVDLKDYVGKLFVLTRKEDSYVRVKEEDGLRYDNNVMLYKVEYNKSWLGEYPTLSFVSDLVSLPEVKLQKDIISDYVQDYFNARGQYLVEGDKLTKVDPKNIDVIIVK